MKHAFCAIFIFQTRSRACLKNHSRDLQAPLCGIFYPHSVAVARYAYVFKVAHSNPYPACMGYSYL